MSPHAIWPGLLVLASVAMSGRDGRWLVLHGVICGACAAFCGGLGPVAGLGVCLFNAGFWAALMRFAPDEDPTIARHRMTPGATLAAIVLAGAGLHAAAVLGQASAAAIAAILASIAGAALARGALTGTASLLRALNASIVLAVARDDVVALVVAGSVWCATALVALVVLPRLVMTRMLPLSPDTRQGRP